MNKKEFKKLLSDDEIAGRIIKDVAHLETMIEIVLMGHFAAPQRHEEFWKIFLRSIVLKQKIDILEKIKPTRNEELQDKAVYTLRKFHKLRNRLAHNKYLFDRVVDKLYTDNQIRKIMKDYPDSYYGELEKAENLLDQLTHLNMIRPQRIRLRKTA